MAYAALLSLAESLDQILDHDQDCIAPDQYSMEPDQLRDCVVLRKKQQIQSLHENFFFLLTFLEDCPKEAGQFEEEIQSDASTSEYIIRNEAGKDLEKVTEIIDFTLKDVMQVKNRISENLISTHSSGPFASILCGEPSKLQGNTSKNLMPSHSRAGSSSSRLAPYEKDMVVGFEKDLMEIKGRLCGEPSKLHIIPITGMGGIGKTTLARYSYDDPSTIDHFDIRIWVTISQNSRLRRILLSLRRSINVFNKDQYEKMDDEIMVQHVYRYLKGRRYLIVMDDMWDTNVWDDVRRIFPDDLNGSRIIITTRELDVASYVDSLNHPHEMHLMGVDQSWNLLKQKVFAQENFPPELEKIGQLIAENCRGLPLAIVVIAGVLSNVNQTQDNWINIAENVIEAVNTSDELISDVLSLSYTHLPHHLRPCFLYMGGFPGDHEINVSKLIKLWVAEGFLRSNESKDMEELGEEYLEDLAKRSLVLINKMSNGKIKAVKLHDVLRDLCLRKARDEKFLHVINEISPSFPEGIENSYRLSILCHISGGLPNSDGSPIHTLLLFQHWAFDSWKKFRLLRVVDAVSVTFKWYPYGIDELCDLRYLAVTFEAPSKPLEFPVPKSLCKLQNLQTLIIRPLVYFKRGRSITTYLPFEIWRMPQLRHLILWDDGFLPDPSTESCLGISALENLHTLSHIKDFTCSEKILEMIPNLKKLGIVYSYKGLYESGWSKYGLNNLVHLCNLEKLSLYAEPYPILKNDVSQNLAFPVTLKRLTLSGCRFPWKDMTIVGSLPNLEVLKLKRRACYGTEWETIEEEFCQLKELLIDSTDLQHWITESSHFPRLERLVLYDCNNLREIPYGIGEIPTLQLIEVDFRNSSIVESAECFKEEQQSFGNDLQVRLLKSRSWGT